MRTSILCVVSVCLFGSSVLLAQPLSKSYPFTVSALDTAGQTKLPGSENIPAVSRISVVDGHFVINAATTHPERIRLFGTELWYTASFMDGEHAKSFAKHLRKLGLNAVRVAFNDYPYYGFNYHGSLCYDSANHSYTADSVAFAMMDTLIYELKQNGIYTFLTLHSSHYYSPADGVAEWDTVHGNCQFVPFIDNRAAELHRKWAKTMLGHINPLTKKRWADDEAIASIEIAKEEFSLFAAWRYGYLNYNGDADVASRYKGGTTIGFNRSRRLDTLNTQYLLRKYKNDAGINAAWKGPSVATAPNLVDDGSFEQLGSPAWSFALQNGASGADVSFGSAIDSQFCELLVLTKLSANPTLSDAYFVNTTVRFKKDSLYELKFWSKIRYNSSSPVLNRSMYIYLSNIQTGANSLAENLTIDTGWKQYNFTFRSTNDGAQNLIFYIGNMLGDVILDGVSIKRKQELGLLPGENSANYMIGRVPFGSTAQLPFQRYRDMMLFYDSLQNNYFTGISKCIKDSIKSAMLINNYSPMYWGTYVDAYANRTSDFTGGGINIDYPYYSAFPNPQVTDSSWRILNTSILSDRGAGALGRPVAYALEGKPHVLSNFWTPSTNQHQTELAPYWAAYASLQDWDGIFFGPYAYYREDLDSDFVQKDGKWWAIGGSPSILSQFPQASDLFRNFKVDAAPTNVTIARDNDDLLLWGISGHFSDPFGVEGGLSQNIATKYKIRGSFGSAFHKIASEYPYIFDTTTKVSETEQLHWSQTQQWFTAASPKYQAAIGYFTGDTVSLGTLYFSRLDTHNDELAISLISMDTNALAKSSNLFLTIGSRSQNSGWKWSGDTTIFNHWGTAPTLMSAAILDFYIPSDSATVTIHPLLGDGTLSSRSYSALKQPSSNIFQIRIDQTSLEDFHSPWYWIEESGSSLGSVAATSDRLLEMEAYPNPAINSSSLRLKLSDYSKIKIAIYDDLGRERILAASGELSQGEHTIILPIATLEAGHYSVRCETLTGINTISLVIVK